MANKYVILFCSFSYYRSVYYYYLYFKLEIKKKSHPVIACVWCMRVYFDRLSLNLTRVTFKLVVRRRLSVNFNGDAY